MKLLLSLFLVFCMASIGFAQIVADDGSIITVNSQPFTPSTLALGSLTTTFAGGNGHSGNMFDITPSYDMTITGMDLNLDYLGGSCDMELYVKDGTSVGYETDSGPWTLEKSGTVIAQGAGNPAYWNLSPWSKVFEAGKTYGIAVYLTNYTSGVTMVRYTNGAATTYSNSDLTLVSNIGIGILWSANFSDRIWNGTIYYDTQAGPATLAVSPLYAGQTGTFTLTSGTPNSSAFLAYSTVGLGSTFVPQLNVVLDLSKPKQAGPTKQTDGTGKAIWNLQIPNGTGGVQVWFQSVQYGLSTNVVHTTIN